MANRELIIRAAPGGTDIALLEDKALIELHKESSTSQFNVGDIFLGRVKKITPGLNAAFVEVGYTKDAFLHYSDLGANIKSSVKFTQRAIEGRQGHLLDSFPFEQEIVKTGKIANVLNKKFPLLVQVVKEPISTKGPRLTSEVTMAGRYLILVPFSNSIGISRKIASAEERKRLQKLLESIRPKNFGVVVRTVAEG